MRTFLFALALLAAMLGLNYFAATAEAGGYGQVTSANVILRDLGPAGYCQTGQAANLTSGYQYSYQYQAPSQLNIVQREVTPATFMLVQYQPPAQLPAIQQPQVVPPLPAYPNPAASFQLTQPTYTYSLGLVQNQNAGYGYGSGFNQNLNAGYGFNQNLNAGYGFRQNLNAGYGFRQNLNLNAGFRTGHRFNQQLNVGVGGYGFNQNLNAAFGGYNANAAAAQRAAIHAQRAALRANLAAQRGYNAGLNLNLNAGVGVGGNGRGQVTTSKTVLDANGNVVRSKTETRPAGLLGRFRRR